MDTGHLSADDANSADGEGVWSPEIEQSFQEALLLFPPCGRRKHILQEEGGGKMYGRNELIARHIMMRTGKSRTRKQVSSHIQVLARRKAKADVSTNGSTSGSTPSPASGSSIRMSSLSSTPQLMMNSATVTLGGGLVGHVNGTTTTYDNNNNNGNGSICSIGIGRNMNDPNQKRHDADLLMPQQSGGYYDVWADRPIVTQKIRLVEFSAFVKHRNSFAVSAAAPGGASNWASSTTNDYLPTAALGLPVDIHHNNCNNNHLHSTNHVHPTNHHNQHHHHHHHLNNNQISSDSLLHQQHQEQTTAAALLSPRVTRNAFVQINYTEPISRHLANRLEEIDIGQIQDKFPGIGGPDGLFQRGPPDSFYLVKFWADLSNDFDYNVDDQNSYFGFSNHFETVDPYRTITSSLKACSYGEQVIEKVDKIYGAFSSSNGRYSYEIKSSPMCEFLIKFIKKLRQMPSNLHMNIVLENFTVLHVITSDLTNEILLCLAYVFEVVAPEQNDGPQHHVYRLTKCA